MHKTKNYLQGPAFDREPRIDTLIGYAQGGFRVIVPTLRRGIDYVGQDQSFGYSVGLDFQPGFDSEDNSKPNKAMIDLARRLGVDQKDIITIWPYDHTNDVILIDDVDSTVYLADEGRRVPYDVDKESASFDGLIIIESPDTKGMVLALTGGDCTPIVGKAELEDGRKVIFGIHAGRKGALSGVVENTVNSMAEIGVKKGSVQVVVGPGAQGMEIPSKLISQESALNPNQAMVNTVGGNWVEMLGKYMVDSELWGGTITAAYSSLTEQTGDLDEAGVDNSRTRVVYNNQADAATRLGLSLQNHGLLSSDGVNVVWADTITDGRLKSHRASTLATKAGDTMYAKQKNGRNITFVRF